MLKSWLKYSIVIMILCLLTLGLLEVTYRFQIIDFYQSELKALNPNLNDDFPNGNVLIIGDSFSGFPKGYVELLRTEYPNTNFINCAISGTGIRQHLLFFEKRVKAFQPKFILYQFYVGNDLLDVKQDYRFRTGTFIRSLYYYLSDHLLILKYLNYKLAILKTPEIKPHNNSEMSEGYNPRIIHQLTINPSYIDESINLYGKQKEKFDRWQMMFQEIINKNDIPAALLILPHCSQVSQFYQIMMEKIGAKATNNYAIHRYPLVEELSGHLNSIALIDPLNYFREKSIDTKLFYENDPHLNLEGQKILGEYLIQQKLFK